MFRFSKGHVLKSHPGSELISTQTTLRVSLPFDRWFTVKHRWMFGL